MTVEHGCNGLNLYYPLLRRVYLTAGKIVKGFSTGETDYRGCRSRPGTGRLPGAILRKLFLLRRGFVARAKPAHPHAIRTGIAAPLAAAILALIIIDIATGRIATYLEARRIMLRQQLHESSHNFSLHPVPVFLLGNEFESIATSALRQVLDEGNAIQIFIYRLQLLYRKSLPVNHCFYDMAESGTQ